MEPWLSPESYKVDVPVASFVNKEHLKISRMYIPKKKRLEDGQQVAIHHQYVTVATSSGIEQFEEIEEFGLWTHSDYIRAIKESCQVENVEFNEGGLAQDGIGLFVIREQVPQRIQKKIYCKIVCNGEWIAQLNYLIERGWTIAHFHKETEEKYRELDDYGKPIKNQGPRGIGWYDITHQCILMERQEDVE